MSRPTTSITGGPRPVDVSAIRLLAGRRHPETEQTPDGESRVQHHCGPQHDADHLKHRAGIPEHNARRDVVDEHSAQEAMLGRAPAIVPREPARDADREQSRATYPADEQRLGRRLRYGKQEAQDNARHKQQRQTSPDLNESGCDKETLLRKHANWCSGLLDSGHRQVTSTRATPIIASRVTIVASRSSLQPSVPAGRRGRTM
jgi:hypothetical protein